ncbi:D-alanyl-D-alanine carboxypeptidase [Bacillus wiedmannii]|uniref:D-alanyl-D-alanine carboxypeptidase family protein n=1 Tax=Bacillus wiedmannii TaxID=1890302 RepID=UPI000BF10424|nr:D-alanyl-D-alanine carboxypeptidase family protein [Bacillus wiedmannii]PEL82501.1 D-alanyl-D-alanine carboxypeptidase [Bacillus wiedmannii]PEM93728.1 D-alanyl-D-alanine carboxypeptidase [Bacillus wiedmannii]PEO82198.1 D-alanyl-D-alanine carboxypeptidase [Bacillus wiedmannii]
MNILKRFKYLFITLIPICMLLFYYQFYVKEPTLHAKSAILMEAESGKILYKKNDNIPLAPASMSKMMTEYIVLERIKNGSLNWNDIVIISQNAVNSEGAKIDVKVGEGLTVLDLFHAMVISSANNAAVALAEHIAKTERDFAKIMNDKAKQLKLSTHTNFVNATGLANEQNEESKMTALDVAKLAQKLLEHYPDVLEVTKLTSYELNHNGVILKTTNKMLYYGNTKLYFQGIDGLKTGFTDEAGYCFTGTAKKDGKRMITVVMGTGDNVERFTETKKLLAYGFQEFALYIPFWEEIKSSFENIFKN